MLSLVVSLGGVLAGLYLAMRARRYPGLRGGLMRLAAIGVAIAAQVLAILLLGPIATILLVLVVIGGGYWWYLNRMAEPDEERYR